MPGNFQEQILVRIVSLSAEGYSQRKVAGISGVSQGCISKILLCNQATSVEAWRSEESDHSPRRQSWFEGPGTTGSSRLLVYVWRWSADFQECCHFGALQTSFWLLAIGLIVPPAVPDWLWITGDTDVCEGERTVGRTSGMSPQWWVLLYAVSQWWLCSWEPQAKGLRDVCIHPTDGNRWPLVMVWGVIHHGGRSEQVVLDEAINWQRYFRRPHDSMLPWATGVFNENLYMSKIMPRPTHHVTRLLFWNNRMWKPRIGQLEVQEWTPLSMFETKSASGSVPELHCLLFSRGHSRY